MYDGSRITNDIERHIFALLDRYTYLDYGRECLLIGDALVILANVTFLFARWINWRNIWKDMRIWPISKEHIEIEPR